MPNIALQRLSEQSALIYSKSPGCVNDGNRDNAVANCAIAYASKNTFWLVDLGTPYLVFTVTVLSARDAGQTNIDPFEIRVGYNKTGGGTNNSLCAAGLNVVAGQLKTVECGNKFGRYVSVNKDSQLFTTLCEMEVYGMVV